MVSSDGKRGGACSLVGVSASLFAVAVSYYAVLVSQPCLNALSPSRGLSVEGLEKFDSYVICSSDTSSCQDSPSFSWTTSFSDLLLQVLANVAAPTRLSLLSPALTTMQKRRIYTGEIDKYSEAVAIECFAVENGFVALTGTENDAKAWCEERSSSGRTCDVRQLEPGHSIVPGLHDAHGHLLDLGWSRNAVNLVGSQSIDEVVSLIESFIQQRQGLLEDENRWVEGLGWDQTKWNPSLFPTADDLIKHSPLLASRKVALRRIDVHALWLSPRALEEMRHAHVLPSPNEEVEGGLIVRDEDGHPTGCFVDKAMDLVYKVLPPWTDERREQFLKAATEELLSVGITSVGDAAVDGKSLAFLQREDDKGKLPLRIYGMLACPPGQSRCVEYATQLGFPRIPASQTRSSRLTVRTVKLFADGALGSWGSAMWEPYKDHDDERGLLLIPETDVEPLIRYWTEHDWQVATHCIGDKAQTIVLDAYESIIRGNSNGSSPRRFRIEHAQLVRLEDIPRFGQLDVIASMQPTHCTSDMGYVETRIGADRARGAYAWQSMLHSNASLALGSDFPVELPNPLHGIYSAVTRLDSEGNSPAGTGGWFPAEKLSRPQALYGFTLAPAYAQFEEGVGGSIVPGKRADFVLFDRDFMDEESTNHLQLRDSKVLTTFIDGEMVWRRPTSLL